MIYKIKANILSGITVSLISIPLSVSLAVASNATPLIGIITAIWSGMIAGFFGGSHFNIVGPTGALSGIIATFVLVHGIANLPLLAITTGIFILLAYVFRLERYLILIPSSVIHGFTLGVACIIGLNQINAAFGIVNLPQQERFFDNVIESLTHLSQASLPTFSVFLLFLIGLFLFKRITPKIPGAILLAPLGIALGYLTVTGVLSFPLQTLGEKFGDISFLFFIAPQITFAPWVAETALVVALVAILETMLSAKIADSMTQTKHHERKELLGLGLANIVSGFMGGMPATAALARTSLNIKTGATHKISAIFNSFFIILISLFLLRFFTYIPMAVIAAILVFVAIQMIEIKHFRRFFHYEKSSLFVSLSVACITVVEDPMVGILLGVTLSLLLFINRLSHGSFDLTVNRIDEGIVGSLSGEKIKEIEENADVLLYSFKGTLCYINSHAHVTRFTTNFTKYNTILLRLREISFMDIDGAEALDEIIGTIESRGQKIMITSVNPHVSDLLNHASIAYQKLKEKGLVFSKTQTALSSLGIRLGEQKRPSKHKP